MQSRPISAPFSTMAPMPDEHAVLDGAAVDHGRVADGDLVADRRSGASPRITWTMVPSWRLVRAPMRIQCTSPRTTTFIQRLLSSPMVTSPMTWALWSTQADGGDRGETATVGTEHEPDYSPQVAVGPRRPCVRRLTDKRDLS